MELRLVDPSRNRYRCYRVSEQPTLFGEVALVIEWGRLGQRLRVRSEFHSAIGRARRRAELLEQRRRHGYAVVR